ncbi:Spc98 family-domain-containing protein [Apiospora arundinis]|uniref:Spindle pole body component n=1 Tax=Apiospora arundinis TaxID=335852 RepID=A0ABR2HYK8_9PEZI
MAHAAALSSLTQELVEVILNQTEPARVTTLRDSSLRSLRYHNHLRTNQFDVEKHINGIEERFRVLNRDGLADALRDRLDALSAVSNKFTPEMLHLLLELSDQPVKKTKLEDLLPQKELLVDPGEQLKWEDIVNEGGSSDDDLWKKPDFNDDSSEDEPLDDDDKDSNASLESGQTSLSSIEAQYRRRPQDYVKTSQDVHLLSRVQQTQAWRLPHSRAPGQHHADPARSELQLLRETLFMLAGLDNDLFDKRGEPSDKYSMHHASSYSLQSVLKSFGNIGRNFLVLRALARKRQPIPLLEVFRDGVAKRLQAFDAVVSNIERRLVDIKEDTVVSLMELQREIDPHARPLLDLSAIIQQLAQETKAQPFRYLELLFDAASTAQLEGQEGNYEFFGRLFFDCFQVYLRPMRRWMDEGELREGDETFFVTKAQNEVSLSQVWENQFTLRRAADGLLHAPRFLQPAAVKIFITGKSVVVLKNMGKLSRSGAQAAEPTLSFEALTSSDLGGFAPFSETFNVAFESWMQSKHHAASSTLRRVLSESCDLDGVVATLHRLYLMSDGYRSDIFTLALFNNLDLLNPKWHDRFVLTELAHDAFHEFGDIHRIIITALDGESQGDIRTSRRSVRKCLPSIGVTYRMAWPIRIVVSGESITHYQSVFTFLLQLRRASHMLQASYKTMKSVGRKDEQALYFGLRSKILWLCACLQSYLSNLVIGPLTEKLRKDLEEAVDVDSMIALHAAFSKRLVAEACLGSKLDPIYQCILDVFDLAIRLEDARRTEHERQAAAEADNSNNNDSPPEAEDRSTLFVPVSEEEDESFLEEQDKSALVLQDDRTYAEVLREIRSGFDRHLRFIAGGLRGVARASTDPAAAKWDTLAEMLETGVPQTAW